MKKIKLVAALLMGISLMGCGRVMFAPSKAGYVPQVIATPDQIEVYRTEKPQGSYTEIGSLHYPREGDLNAIVEKMKVVASQEGGNAIIDLQVNSVGVIATVVKVNK